MKNIIIALVLICITSLFYACKEKKNENMFTQKTCAEISDMANALPKLENYEGYKLKNVQCLAVSRAYFLTYSLEKDTLAELTISLRDGRASGNEVFITNQKQNYDNAEGQYKYSYISNIIGQFGSIYTRNDLIENEPIKTEFSCILKDKYALNISATNNTELINRTKFEFFLNDFVSKINIDSLK